MTLFDGASDPVKITITQAIPQYGTPEAWRAVLRALAAKPAKATQHTVALAVMRYGSSIPAQMQPLFAEELLTAAATQKNVDVLDFLVRAVGKVGTFAHVPALQTLLKDAASPSQREYIVNAIADCEKRGKP